MKVRRIAEGTQLLVTDAGVIERRWRRLMLICGVFGNDSCITHVYFLIVDSSCFNEWRMAPSSFFDALIEKR
ncbi:hypothetical protein K239x_33060 [Planctomycetes bacterium K23_9]|uniref:Uncharacterized protein n=1 Tax=Stieleria marina TaxID=1930275 RepID=A0A517NW10_9BACT|nr:hypothetical protein K239x_33060 [Planctomycetes bacterium K23_9]